MSMLGVNFAKKMQVDLHDKVIVTQGLGLSHKNNSGSLLTYFDAIRESTLKGCYNSLQKHLFGTLFGCSYVLIWR
jgi:hypothetical protein